MLVKWKYAWKMYGPLQIFLTISDLNGILELRIAEMNVGPYETKLLLYLNILVRKS